jgi:micrococcal nuclease
VKPIAGLAIVAVAVAAAGCGGGAETAIVTNIVDGETVDLDTGIRIRYLMIDTPESTGGATDCFGQNAKVFNSDLVLDKEVELTYDVEREDRFGRTLAYVAVDGMEVNTLLVERGYACVLFIPPNGEDRRIEFETLEATAKMELRGMWGSCTDVTCD